MIQNKLFTHEQYSSFFSRSICVSSDTSTFYIKRLNTFRIQRIKLSSRKKGKKRKSTDWSFRFLRASLPPLKQGVQDQDVKIRWPRQDWIFHRGIRLVLPSRPREKEALLNDTRCTSRNRTSHVIAFSDLQSQPSLRLAITAGTLKYCSLSTRQCNIVELLRDRLVISRRFTGTDLLAPSTSITQYFRRLHSHRPRGEMHSHVLFA